MGKHDVNIASMSLSRDEAGGQALTVLNLDSVPRRRASGRTPQGGRHRLLAQVGLAVRNGRIEHGKSPTAAMP